MVDLLGPYKIEVQGDKFILSNEIGFTILSNEDKYVYNIPPEFKDQNTIPMSNYKEKHYTWKDN